MNEPFAVRGTDDQSHRFTRTAKEIEWPDKFRLQALRELLAQEPVVAAPATTFWRRWLSVLLEDV